MLAIRSGTRSRGSDLCTMPVSVRVRDRISVIQSSPRQFTVRTLSDIENGVRKASPGTYAMLENKLGWAPGSIDTILAGGEPKELVVKLRPTTPTPRTHAYTTDAVSDTITDTLSRASTEELLLELRRRIIRPRNRRYETWDEWGDGLDAQGSWPEER
jgi:hypothetical protein